MKKILMIALALLVAGCTQKQLDQVKRITPTQLLGMMAGGAAGGIIGAQIGGGIGKSLMITTGAIAGVAGGYLIARKLERSDRAAHDKTATQALAEAPDGTSRYWENPQTGSSGIIVPVRSYVAGDGAVCRDYRTTVAVKEGFIRGRGMGCQQASGAWHLKMDDLG